jgi:hypothetical protein
VGTDHIALVKDELESIGQKAELAPYRGKRMLNLGCGAALEPVWAGWDNADINLRTGANLVFDMRSSHWPIRANTYDINNVLHQFTGWDLFRVMWEIGAVLKLGGHLIGIVPYGWTGSPFQQQYWNEFTPARLIRSTYFGPNAPLVCEDQLVPLHNWEIREVKLYGGGPGSMRFIMRLP